jgi:hypothetical protein
MITVTIDIKGDIRKYGAGGIIGESAADELSIYKK